MADLLARAWRSLRRPAMARAGAVAAVAGRDGGNPPAARRRPGRDHRTRWCGASGWQMRSGCSDGDGGTICPLCSQRVRTEPDTVAHRGVEVIQAHCA